MIKDELRKTESMRLLQEEADVLEDSLLFLKKMFMFMFRTNDVRVHQHILNEKISDEKVGEMSVLMKAAYCKEILDEVDFPKAVSIFKKDEAPVIITTVTNVFKNLEEMVTRDLFIEVKDYLSDLTDLQSTLEISKNRVWNALYSQSETLQEIEDTYIYLADNYSRYHSVVVKSESFFSFWQKKNSDYLIDDFHKKLFKLLDLAIEWIEKTEQCYTKALDDIFLELERLSKLTNKKFQEAVDEGLDYRPVYENLKAISVEANDPNNPNLKRFFNVILDEMIREGLSINSENYLRTSYGI